MNGNEVTERKRLEAFDALDKLAKWRSVFAGWQLGSRIKGDPESDAVRDHREVSILLRAEVNAIIALLVEKGIVTLDEWLDHLKDEAIHLDAAFERRFPGFSTYVGDPGGGGVHIDMDKARETMKTWRK